MKAALLACASLLVFATMVVGQSSPLPLISSPFNPINAVPGGAAFSLSVYGANFTSSSVVNWNGSPRPTTFVSGAQLTAAISAADVASPTTANVTVVNPPPGGGTSNVAQFHVITAVSGLAYKGVSLNTQYLPNLAVDVNNDGHLDVVSITSNKSTGELHVNLGKGDGGFEPTLTTTVEGYTYALDGGDFNKDGNYDLAIANATGTVSVLLGNGDGTFQTHVDYPTGTKSTGLAVADFNGDGNADLVVANDAPSGGVSVLLGLGNGLFQTQAVYPAGAYPSSVTVGDFNGDGRVDVAAAAQDYAAVLLGKGDGTFQRASLYYLGRVNTYSVRTADLNRDGILDVLVGSTSKVHILLGKGDGSFRIPTTSFVGATVTTMVTGDFNEDGALDIATAPNSGSDIYILLGKGNGINFQHPVAVPNGSQGNGLAVGDFNEDGYPDLSAGSAVLLQATASLSPAKLAFPDTYVGQSSAPQNLTLSNYAAASLPVQSVSISAQATSYAQTNTCGDSVPANGSCTIAVVFSPKQTGFLQATLKVDDGSVNSPQLAILSGTGLTAVVPMVTLDPTSLTFGSQKVGTTSAAQNVTLTNSGTAKLTISGIAASGDFAQTNTCGTTLLVGQDCTIIVTFTPTATGTRTGVITLTDNAGNSPQTVPLTGTGTN